MSRHNVGAVGNADAGNNHRSHQNSFRVVSFHPQKHKLRGKESASPCLAPRPQQSLAPTEQLLCLRCCPWEAACAKTLRVALTEAG